MFVLIIRNNRNNNSNNSNSNDDSDDEERCTVILNLKKSFDPECRASSLFLTKRLSSFPLVFSQKQDNTNNSVKYSVQRTHRIYRIPYILTYQEIFRKVIRVQLTLEKCCEMNFMEKCIPSWYIDCFQEAFNDSGGQAFSVKLEKGVLRRR